MIKFCLTIILLVIGLSGQAQSATSHCDGSRYLTKVFPNVSVTKNVLFGNNITYGGVPKDLLMDIYEPQGDVATLRPVVVLAFGGSYINGQRSDLDELCRYIATRGYVAATVDYRLYDGPLFPIPSTSTMVDAAIKAMGDIKAAIRYFKQDAATANTYQIDSNFVFVGGASSGAISANYVAYLEVSDVNSAEVNAALNVNGGLEGNSSYNFQYGTSVSGVLSYSGAVLDTTVIDPTEAPLFMVHDDQDPTVSYGTGHASIYGTPLIAVEGSNIMSIRATNIGLKNSLITIPNSPQHVSYFLQSNTVWKDSVLHSSGKFLQEIICSSGTVTVPEIKTLDVVSIYPNPSNGFVNVDFKERIINTVEVSTIDGRIILKDEYVNAPNYQFQLTGPSGMYILKTTAQGKTEHFQLIKK